jgi:hypothetical protein
LVTGITTTYLSLRLAALGEMPKDVRVQSVSFLSVHVHRIILWPTCGRHLSSILNFSLCSPRRAGSVLICVNGSRINRLISQVNCLVVFFPAAPMFSPNMQEVPLVSYQDFLEILLAVVGVAIGLVAIELGVLAFIGFVQLGRMAQNHVRSAMKKELRRVPETQQVVNMYREIKEMHESLKKMHTDSKETWEKIQELRSHIPTKRDPLAASPDTGVQEKDEPVGPDYPGDKNASD